MQPHRFPAVIGAVSMRGVTVQQYHISRLGLELVGASLDQAGPFGDGHNEKTVVLASGKRIAGVIPKLSDTHRIEKQPFCRLGAGIEKILAFR